MFASLRHRLGHWLLRDARREVAASPEAEIAALLGREAVDLDTPELQRFLANKRIVVTGAGGSIGSEICRQALRFCPSRLTLIERCENALFEIDRELRARWVGADIRPLLVDVNDAGLVDRVIGGDRPAVIFHAAAHKHVPLMETNAGEAVRNNVLGTRNVADSARRHGAGAFVLISTDKAVNPTSVMGATKRCAELYVQSLAAEEGVSTRFVTVRFGNVLGSSGSVVPIFRRQIEAGGPVTVTHPEMRRYFMTIPEASQLVMQAGAIGRGGDILLLDMGEPVRILDLAREMIRRAGLREGEDIDIRFSGIRPGEKLFEELTCSSERTEPTAHGKIHVWRAAAATRRLAERMVKDLETTTGSPRATVLGVLREYVPEFGGGEQTAAPMRVVA